MLCELDEAIASDEGALNNAVEDEEAFSESDDDGHVLSGAQRDFLRGLAGHKRESRTLSVSSDAAVVVDNVALSADSNCLGVTEETNIEVNGDEFQDIPAIRNEIEFILEKDVPPQQHNGEDVEEDEKKIDIEIEVVKREVVDFDEVEIEFDSGEPLNAEVDMDICENYTDIVTLIEKKEQSSKTGLDEEELGVEREIENNVGSEGMLEVSQDSVTESHEITPQHRSISTEVTCTKDSDVGQHNVSTHLEGNLDGANATGDDEGVHSVQISDGFGKEIIRLTLNPTSFLNSWISRNDPSLREVIKSYFLLFYW